MHDHKMYFAQDGLILVSFAGYNLLAFDKRGYIIDQKSFNLARPLEIIADSKQTNAFSKYFLMRDSKE